jgi:hypothetical protein
MCNTCLVFKSESEFYCHPKSLDGLLGKCKDCQKQNSTKNRNLNLETKREYDKQRASKPERQQQRKDWQKNNPKRAYEIKHKWRKLNPEKVKAHNIVRRAIKNGNLKRLPCEVCGNTLSQAHHNDYNKPLDVIWLCRPHHPRGKF